MGDTTTGHAADVRQVYDLMSKLKVSLSDLELFGYIENKESCTEEPEEGDLKVSVDEAFNALSAAGFSLWELNAAADFYYQATADYVTEALDEHGLLVEEEPLEFWLGCSTYHDEVDQWTTFAQGPYPSLEVANACGWSWSNNPGSGITATEWEVHHTTRSDIEVSYKEIYVNDKHPQEG